MPRARPRLPQRADRWPPTAGDLTGRGLRLRFGRGISRGEHEPTRQEKALNGQSSHEYHRSLARGLVRSMSPRATAPSTKPPAMTGRMVVRARMNTSRAWATDIAGRR